MRRALILLAFAGIAWCQPIPPAVKQPCSATVTTNCTPQVNGSGAIVPSSSTAGGWTYNSGAGTITAANGATVAVGTTVLGPYTLSGLNALNPGTATALAVVTDSSNCTSQTIGQVQLCRFVSAGVWASIGGSGGSSTATEYNVGTCTTTASIDAANGAYQRLLLGGNCTLSFVQPASGVLRIQLTITQGASPYTGTWTSVLWPSGIAPVISAGSGAVDVIACYLNGTTTKCTAAQSFQ